MSPARLAFLVPCLALIAGACEDTPGADAPPPLPPEPPATAEEPVAARDDEPDPIGQEEAVPPATPGQKRMHGRYGRVEGVRDALVVADLVAAQRLARGLDQPLSAKELPEAAAGLHDAVPQRSKALLDAKTLPKGARAFAQVMLACGQCHQAADVSWSFDEPGWPDGDELDDHMGRHVWAIDRMWEGLMLGDADRFDRGARRFAEAPLTGEVPVEDEHPPGLSAIAARLHKRARQAERAKDMRERAAIYGDILAACGDCHTRIGALDARGASAD
jgi:cytochrome c553